MRSGHNTECAPWCIAVHLILHTVLAGCIQGETPERLVTRRIPVATHDHVVSPPCRCPQIVVTWTSCNTSPSCRVCVVRAHQSFLLMCRVFRSCARCVLVGREESCPSLGQVGLGEGVEGVRRGRQVGILPGKLRAGRKGRKGNKSICFLLATIWQLCFRHRDFGIFFFGNQI